jgi:RNA-directed DNA polymerase
MTRMYQIDKKLIYKAWLGVKANAGADGIDAQTIAEFDKDWQSQLYKLWNRMSSGSYMASPVRKVEIPKSDGGKRCLGIPTVADRVAQATVKAILEPGMDKEFHPCSYGYRPNKSAHDAIGQARQNCFKYGFVVDIDIRGYFDNIPHDLLLEMVRGKTKEPWIILYITRWLKAELQDSSGIITERDKGTPQGGVISPLLANLYLDQVFDRWMEIKHPKARFERFADDIIIHCATRKEAEEALSNVRTRMEGYGLELHPEKTKIVHCKNRNRQDQHLDLSKKFDFLGYEFKPRTAKERDGSLWTVFTPAISTKAKKRIREKIKSSKVLKMTNITTEQLARSVNKYTRGIINYYGKFRKSELDKVFYILDYRIVKWVRKKYKSCKGRRAGWKELLRLKKENAKLFAHW